MENTRLLSTRQDTVRFNLGVPLKALQKRHLPEETCVATLVNARLAPRMGMNIIWKWSESVSHSVVSVSAITWTATRLLCPRDSPGKNTGVGCHSLLQDILQPSDQIWVSHNAGGFFTIWAPGKPWNSTNLDISQTYVQTTVLQDFPGGPVAETLSSQCRWSGFDPGQGIRSHVAKKVEYFEGCY